MQSVVMAATLRRFHMQAAVEHLLPEWQYIAAEVVVASAITRKNKVCKCGRTRMAAHKCARISMDAHGRAHLRLCAKRRTHARACDAHRGSCACTAARG